MGHVKDWDLPRPETGENSTHSDLNVAIEYVGTQYTHVLGMFHVFPVVRRESHSCYYIAPLTLHTSLGHVEDWDSPPEDGRPRKEKTQHITTVTNHITCNVTRVCHK